MDYLYSLGNPLLDTITQVTDQQLQQLNLEKGSMNLIDPQKLATIVDFIANLDSHDHPGGSGPNTARVMAKLGTPAIVAGAVGSDAPGASYKALNSRWGAQDQLISVDQPTGRSFIFVTPEGERTMATFLGANQHMGPEALNQQALRGAAGIYFTAYMLDTPNQRSAVDVLLQNTKSQNIPIYFDLADPFAVDRHHVAIKTVLAKGVRLVLANEAEAKAFTKTSNGEMAAAMLSGDAEYVLIKLGAQGVLAGYWERNEFVTEHFKGYPATVVDTTGAGDCFAGAAIAALVQGHDIATACRWGNWFGARVVEQIGAMLEPEKIEYLKRRIPSA